MAKNGRDAIVMAEEEDFDLIISDIRMPGLDGVTTVKEILETIKKKGRSKVPAIFITGYADENIEAQAKLLNPRAYVYKPFDYTEFLEKVKEALQQTVQTGDDPASS